MPSEDRFVPNESFWLEAIDREHLAPPLEGVHEADVVCLGGGYTSLVTAYLLKKREPRLEVAVVESRYVGFGASGRNAGMVLQEPHLDRLERRGAEAVRFTFWEAARSVDFIETLAREEGFDCELERSGYLEIALLPAHERRNDAIARAARALGVELPLLDRESMQSAIRSERFRSALRFPNGAMLHPGKYVSGLKRAVVARGVRLFEHSPVLAVEQSRHGIEVRTPGGRLRAPKLVLGLNAYLEAAGLGLVRPRAVSLFSFIILTEPLSERHWKEMGWSGREGYSDRRRLHNYVRLTGDRLLFGGRVTYRFGLQSPRGLEAMYDNLKRELLLTFPALEGVELTHRWCGPIAITWRRTPMIGRGGRDRNIYYGLGYSGMGVSLATLSGRVLADLVAGDEDHWKDLLYLHDPHAPLPPEPFRFLGFEGGYLGMRVLDFLDRLR